jgi:hypothetical protein
VGRFRALGAIVACALCVAILLEACDSRFGPAGIGDAGHKVRFENGRDEPIALAQQYDGPNQPLTPIVTVPPHSADELTIMIQGTGVRLVGRTPSGQVVFDHHYAWSEIPPGATPLTVVIK